ncbi:hypothetical protein BG011_004417 [Mortierella polycephala]|uniref:Uncharacterized protein n=1 Tax=Mortierella polycephala TaxID=41804 RepID=A0A9P6Q067_9FUNG|nr:hypothetical protein BG011_004417 [Mortierella polycephala]
MKVLDENLDTAVRVCTFGGLGGRRQGYFVCTKSGCLRQVNACNLQTSGNIPVSSIRKLVLIARLNLNNCDGVTPAMATETRRSIPNMREQDFVYTVLDVDNARPSSSVAPDPLKA